MHEKYGLSKDQFDTLLTATESKDFSFDGTILAKIVSIYDGDTVRAVFFHGNQIVQYKIRMAGYDSPEMKPLKNIPNRDELIKKAKEAKAALSTKILNKVVVIKCNGFDKYGRILGNVYDLESDENINNFMVTGGYAKPYDGGKKQ